MYKNTNCICMNVLCAQAGRCLKENQAYTQPAPVHTYFEPIKIVPTEQDIKQAERRELFKQVALTVGKEKLQLKTEKSEKSVNEGQGVYRVVEEWRPLPEFAEGKKEYLEALTEAILKAADQFAKKGEG